MFPRLVSSCIVHRNLRPQIEHHLMHQGHLQINDMVKRFNERISETLESTRFDSSADLKQTLKNCQVGLQPPDPAVDTGTCHASADTQEQEIAEKATRIEFME